MKNASQSGLAMRVDEAVSRLIPHELNVLVVEPDTNTAEDIASRLQQYGLPNKTEMSKRLFGRLNITRVPNCDEAEIAIEQMQGDYLALAVVALDETPSRTQLDLVDNILQKYPDTQGKTSVITLLPDSGTQLAGESLIARVSDSVPVYQKTAEGIAEFVKRAAKSLNFQDLLISNAHEGRDELTGLKNRRSLTHRLEQLDKRGYEDYLPASVIIVDIDYFKAVNDVYGHNAGDEVLYQVAEFLVSHMGESNTYRLGGEEFCIVMEGYTPEEVQERFEKLKKDIAEKGFDTGKGQRIYKTASVGICSLPDPESAESMRGNNRDWTKDAIDRADKCLYLAKRHGRNRIVSCNELDCIDSVMALFIKSEGISEDASGLDAAAAKERIIASLKREYSKRDLVEHSKVQAIIDSNAQSCIKVFDDAITYCIDTPKIADKDDFGRFFRNLVLDMFSMYRRHIPYAVGNEFDASKAETAISEELSGMPDNFDKVFKRRVATKNEYGVKVWIRGYTPGMERAAIDYVVDVFNRHLRVQPKHKSSYDSDSQPDEVRIVMPQDSGRKGDVECIIHCLDSHSAETVYQRLKGRLRAGYSEQLKRDPRLNLEMERVGWEESDIR